MNSINFNEQNKNSNFQSDISDNPLEDLNIRDLFTTVKKGKKILLLMMALFFSYAATYSFAKRIIKPTYEGSFQILINDPMQNDKKGGIQNELVTALNQEKNEYDIQTLIPYLKSPIFLKKIANEYKYDPIELSKIIKISQVRKDGKLSRGILNFSIEINDFKVGEKILNSLSKFYLEEAFLQRKTRYEKALKFLEEQTPILVADNIKARNDLSRFQKKYSLIDPFLEGKEIKAQEINLEESKIILNTNTKQIKELIEGIKKGEFSTRGFSETSSLSKLIKYESVDKSIIEKFLQAKEELAVARSKYTSTSTVVNSLEKRINLLKPQLQKAQLKALNSALKLNQNEIDTINKKIANLKNSYLRLPALFEKFADFKIKVEISEKLLKELYTAKERFQLDSAQTNVPWKLIKEPAMSKIPYKPNIPKNLFLSLAFGAIVGSLITIIKERFDNKFTSGKSITEKTGMPVLGEVPYISALANIRNNRFIKMIDVELDKNDSNQEKASYERFFYKEAMRNIYTAIRFSNIDKKIKTLAITSSIPSEGKSIINILFAKSLAELGLRVLLIDSDLRKPQIHKRLSLNNFKGFSNLLVDDSVKLEDVIQTIEQTKNLSIIPSGIIPPNPTALLSSNRMQNITNSLNENKNFDFIIFDLPPVQGLADTFLVSEYVNGFIFIASLNNVQKPVFLDCISKIKSRNVNILGIITNFIRESDFKKYKNDLNNEYSYTYQYYGANNDNKTDKDDDKGLYNSKFFKALSNLKKKLVYWIEN